MSEPAPRASPGPSRLTPARITLIYLLIGAAWIFLSDTLVGWKARDPNIQTAVSIAKGLAYVLITGAILFVMIDRHAAVLMRSADALRQSDETQRSLARTQQTLLTELDHRVKNNLAALYSLICLYEQSAGSVPAFADAMRGKLLAMRAIHEAIAGAGWQAVDLNGLVHTLYKLVAPPDRPIPAFTALGPALRIAPRQAGPLAMALQELMANARKHGALSAPDGKVEVSWCLARHESAALELELIWQESGGPPVAPPTHKGQGLGLLEGFARFDLCGAVTFAFAPPGFRCVLRAKLDPVV